MNDLPVLITESQLAILKSSFSKPPNNIGKNKIPGNYMVGKEGNLAFFDLEFFLCEGKPSEFTLSVRCMR